MINCPECATPVGQGTSLDPYKHALACMHVTPAPLDEIVREYTQRGDEHGKRVVILIEAAQAGT